MFCPFLAMTGVAVPDAFTTPTVSPAVGELGNVNVNDAVSMYVVPATAVVFEPMTELILLTAPVTKPECVPVVVELAVMNAAPFVN